MANEMKIQFRQVSASTSEVTMGNHHVLVDRPTEKGGTGSGPMGGELFLAGVGGCFMSTLLAAIRARESKVSDVHMEVTGTVDGTPPQFTGVELFITAESADREMLDRLVEVADRGCIMMNTLRGKLDLRIRVGVPA
jgi:putative redox protein